MKQYALPLVLALAWIPLGCGGGGVDDLPDPPEITPELKAKIEAEDSAVEADESQN
jgi:hypothetical protein